MISLRKCFIAIIIVSMCSLTGTVRGKKLTVGIVQTVIENTLEQNRNKLIRFVDEAKVQGCQLAILPEGALYWADIAIDKPTKAEFDVAIEQIGQRARQAGIWVIFGTSYKLTDNGEYHNRGVVYNPDGKRVLFYRKNQDVPQRFFIHGIPCNLVICSDRGYLEHSDLPCLVQGSQVIIDISGGHGGDDGRPDLRLIRYRPWAKRTNAYVIVSNPVHDDTDFMGNSPWGGGSAIIRPDGSIQASRRYEKDVMLVEEINTEKATLAEAKLRINHPLFHTFWDAGRELLEEIKIEPVPQITPYTSAERTIKVAAAQIACSRDIDGNISTILRHIAQAAQEDADIVVFPELALTGALSDDILSVRQSRLDDALIKIRNAAKKGSIYVILGMPYDIDGARRNCAFVISDNGTVQTRYSQIVVKRSNLFQPGTSTKAMWFNVKSVHAIVTIGDDVDWIEIADLAASRGMYLHFHLSYQTDASPDDATFIKQRNLLFLRYAKCGLVVNAASPSRLHNPSLPANGMSMIVSREGGHNQASPARLEYYLPYQTSIVCSAGLEETVIYAKRKTTRTNNLDLRRNWRNRNRKARPQRDWYDWITKGAEIITGEYRP